MSWLKRTIADDAKDFETQLAEIKIVLYKHFTREFKANILEQGKQYGDYEEKLFGAYSGQLINYLLGEDGKEMNKEVDDETKDIINEIKPLISERATAIMEADKSLREAIVYTLRMKLVLNQYSKGADFIQTMEGRIITDLLNKYGGEFQEEITPKKYREIINQLIQADILKEINE